MKATDDGIAGQAEMPSHAHSTPDFGNRELHITIVRDVCACFLGSAALLQAEGLTPEGFE
jgi:hypothetical protein